MLSESKSKLRKKPSTRMQQTFYLFVPWLTFRLWRWRQDVSPKCRRTINGLYGQKAVFSNQLCRIFLVDADDNNLLDEIMNTLKKIQKLYFSILLHYLQHTIYIVQCWGYSISSDPNCTCHSLRTPFGLVIPYYNPQSHVITFTHNYFLRCYAFTQL
jgi:hypothetical protein